MHFSLVLELFASSSALQHYDSLPSVASMPRFPPSCSVGIRCSMDRIPRFFVLVMCLFILLNLSLMPAIISLVILGFGLVFILLTLLTYFSVWQSSQIDGGLNSSIYHTVDATHVCDDEIDLTKTDELSTLV